MFLRHEHSVWRSNASAKHVFEACLAQFEQAC
jgi:hypothetical protein